MEKHYDLAVIGGGPAGYAAAIRGSQLQKSVVVIEKSRLGGTCLNRGCIPTKSLLESSGLYKALATSESHGITIGDVKLDYSRMVDRKDGVVNQLISGLEFLMKHKKIDVIAGEATLQSNQEIVVRGEEECSLTAEKIVVATGTYPASLRGLEPDGTQILNSDQLLDLRQLPSSILIVGGGVIGCEFATVFRSLGVDVTIIELMDRLLPTEDEEIAKSLAREFKKAKIAVLTDAKVQNIAQGASLVVSFEQKGKEKQITVDKVLVSIGRKPVLPHGFTGDLTKNGYIQVDEQFQSTMENIYAAGDCIGGLQLAHLAFEEGISAVNFAFGLVSRNSWHVPRCVYTHPEIGAVGLTEEQAKEEFGTITVGKFSLKGNGKALILGDTSGFCKVIADPQGKVVGVNMIGPHATELIAEAALAVESGVTLEKWAEVVHPHPTVSESVKESVLAALGLGLHS